jgi:hypothetical protein
LKLERAIDVNILGAVNKQVNFCPFRNQITEVKLMTKVNFTIFKMLKPGQWILIEFNPDTDPDPAI